MKRLLSILLATMMMFTLMAPAAVAAGSAAVSVTSASANAGGTVTVAISLSGLTEGVTNGELKVSADSALKLIALEPENLPGSVIANPASGKVIFSHTDPVSVSALAVATFKVDEDAVSGDYYISAVVTGMRNGAGLRVSANPGTGKITVHAHAATGDWKTNSTHHWHTCSCGQVLDKADHVPQTGVPATDALYCSICGYKLRDAQPVEPEHVCDFGAWAPYSEVQHMRVCATDSTHVEYANHNFVDNVCADCGYVLEIIIPGTPDEFDGLTIEELILIMMMGNCTNTITATAGEGGMISPAGATNVPFAKDQTYVITPMPGYEIDSVVVDGKDKGAINQYTFKRVLAKHTITATFKKMPWVNHFKDVKENDWFYSDVAYVNSIGLMVGTSSTEFSPNETATRAQIVTTLWRLEGQPVAQTKADFTDVAEDMWYTDAIAWAAENKIVEGYGDGIFAPGDAITREQIVAILHRYAEYKELAVAAEDEAPDAYDHSDWAADNVDWAHENGIFAGIGKDITDLTENATRAEIASYLTRFCLMILA